MPDDDTFMPAKDIEQLIYLLNSCIDECDAFLQTLGVSLDSIIGENSTFNKLNALRSVYDTIVTNDENKDKQKKTTQPTLQ